jgi:chromosome segregation ATPase
VKEWRSHLDQTKKYAETVKGNLPDVRMKLEKVSDEVSRALEKISKKEAMLNKGMAGMTGNYKSTSTTLKGITDDNNKIKAHIEEMEAQYYEIEEELTKIQSMMDDVGKNISDQSPLLKIKKAIEKV